MRVPFVLALSLLPLARTPAQSGATLRTFTDVRSDLFPFGGSTLLPAQTNITTPTTVAVGGSVDLARTAIDPSVPLTLTINCTAQTTPAGNYSAFARTIGTVDWTLPGGQYGTLSMSASVVAFNGSYVQADVGADVSGPGIHESFVTPQRTVSHNIGFVAPYTLRIAFGASVSAAGPHQALGTVTLRISFTPQALPAVQQQRFGTPCGATLTVADTTTQTSHQLTIAGAGGAPNGVFGLVFGVRPASVPLPGSPCQLLVEPATVLVLIADPNGAFRLVAPIPGPLSSIPIDLQAIAVDPTSPARASDRVEITFADL